MPVATSRTRHSSQAQAGPSRPRTAGRGTDPENEEVNGEMEEEDGWTMDTFTDKPIDKNSTAIINLRTLSDKLKDVISRIEEGLEAAKETAFAIEDAHQDDEAINQVESTIFKALDQRQLLQIKIDILDSLSSQLRAGKAFTNIQKEFLERSREKEVEYLEKSQRAKYKKVKDYVDFRTHLWEINHPSACPPMSQWLSKNDDDDSSDEELEIGGQTQNYRCPITLTLYKDVVTSTKCGHSYSRLAIEDMITNAKKSRRAAKCPQTGCSVILEKQDIKSNPTLQRRTDEFAKRQQRRDDDEDEDIDDLDDEVV